MTRQLAAFFLGLTLVATVNAKIKESDYKTDFLVVASTISTGDSKGGPCFMILETVDGIQYSVQSAGTLSKGRAFRSGLHLPGRIVNHFGGVKMIELIWQMDEHDEWRLARYFILRTSL